MFSGVTNSANPLKSHTITAAPVAMASITAFAFPNTMSYCSRIFSGLVVAFPLPLPTRSISIPSDKQASFIKGKICVCDI
ncbi:hypothetical protein FLACHUCJ7_04472 [Flavobacterium chungangense]|uniref:Uncharacterized protein n=1 Tax=Flavobacterium chungangense TaxID=554283 RepID=A0A6V6ZFY3_9FLAO|nr:hypothetical protein FLACHUCJ7_04472 [Flavobacterium chungangense]